MPHTNYNEVRPSATRQFFWQLATQNNNIENQAPLPSSTADELDNYLQSLPDENVEPLIWWKAHQKEYPILSMVARDYLSIQATSVACEQAFSTAGHTISKTRNRLHSETARACLCGWRKSNKG